MEKDILKNFITDFTTEVGNNIISVKILSPTDIHFKNLRELLYIEKDKKDLYSEFEKKYIEGKDGEVIRSLTFLKYNDAVKYQAISTFMNAFIQIKNNFIKVFRTLFTDEDGCDLIDNTDTKSAETNLNFTIIENTIDISELVIKSKNNIHSNKLIKENWKSWCDLVKKNFQQAKSTIWSYIVIRTGTEEYLVCSTYLILSVKLGYKKRHILNKKSQDYLYALVLNQFKQNILKQSKINTIAVIMSKNLSHTDGSHVMVDFENNTSKELYTLEDGYINKKLTKKNIEDINISINDKAKKFNTQFKLYNQHLRNTMELVADVSGKIGIQSNYEYCLKEFFAELENDYFAKDKSPKIINNLKREVRFLGRGLNDGDGCSILDTSSIRFVTNESNANQYSSNNKIIKALFPGGENGRTAFISILKNIFRNLKKHSKSKTDKAVIDLPFYQLEVNIIEDENEAINKDYYKLELKETSRSYPLKDEYKGGKLIDQGITPILKKIRNHLLIEGIIDNEGIEKKDGWGLLEMRICAAYIIGLPLDEFNYDKNEELFQDTNGRTYPMNFINVDKCEGEERRFHLCHYLYLRKPKFATIWLPEEKFNSINENSKKFKELSDAGFSIKKVGDNKKYSSPSKFIVGDEKAEKTSTHYNFRVIRKDFCYDIEKDSVEDIKQKIVEEWLNVNKFTIQKMHYKNGQSIEPFDFEDELKFKENTDTTLEYDKTGVALLDNHFKYLKKLHNELKKLHNEFDDCQEKTLTEIKKNFKYFENESSNNKSKNAFEGAKKFEILECLNTNVTIFDERIQKYLLNTKDTDTDDIYTLKQVNELKGVYTADFSLKEYFYESNKNLEDLIEDLKKAFKNSKYVILHFSGFEKIVERSNISIDEAKKIKKIDEANKQLYELTKKGGNYIIFTSGKGIPKTLPEKCYFMPYTTLKVLIEKKPKFDLVTALHSMRLIKGGF